jgi:hypothetical protein
MEIQVTDQKKLEILLSAVETAFEQICSNIPADLVSNKRRLSQLKKTFLFNIKSKSRVIPSEIKEHMPLALPNFDPKALPNPKIYPTLQSEHQKTLSLTLEKLNQAGGQLSNLKTLKATETILLSKQEPDTSIELEKLSQTIEYYNNKIQSLTSKIAANLAEVLPDEPNDTEKDLIRHVLSVLTF